MYKKNILRVRYLEIKDVVFKLGENLLEIKIMQVWLCCHRLSPRISTKQVRCSSSYNIPSKVFPMLHFGASLLNPNNLSYTNLGTSAFIEFYIFL